MWEILLNLLWAVFLLFVVAEQSVFYTVNIIVNYDINLYFYVVTEQQINDKRKLLSEAYFMKKRIEFDVDINEFDLLRVLAKELHMEFALDDNTYYIKKAEWGEPEVWMEGKNGSNDECVDDRAELFVALRNLANAMCPNCEFRSERTIYNIEHLCI